MLTAFGYDYVPGNLAGALALREAGDEAVRVDTGYYFTGPSPSGPMSGGTRASLAGVMTAPAFAFRDGRVLTERGAARYRTFEVDGKARPAVSVGTSCHFGLPRVAPQLREVNAYLGWFGAMSRPMQAVSLAGAMAARIPGFTRLTEAASAKMVKGSSGGPDAEERGRFGSRFVAIAYDSGGSALSEVHLSGLDGYTLRPSCWPGVRSAPRPADCAARALSGRSTASASTSSRPAVVRRASAALADAFPPRGIS